VAALEHFTAALGQWWIQNRGLDYAGTDPVTLDLLRWHGAEEVEHRSLVFDVYQNVCGNSRCGCPRIVARGFRRSGASERWLRSPARPSQWRSTVILNEKSDVIIRKCRHRGR
jgi:hypothetical protein